MERPLYRLLVALAPPPVREWIAAMLAEAQVLPGRARAGWYLAAARIAIAARLRRSIWVQATALASVMIAVDWTWGALLPALVLIAFAAVAIRQPAAAALVAGGTLPGAHAVANWVSALRPHYQFAPLNLRDWAALAAVALIGCCAVQVAHRLRALARG